MNKEIIAPASDNEHRYLLLYKESININSRLEDLKIEVSTYGRRCLLQLVRRTMGGKGEFEEQ